MRKFTIGERVGYTASWLRSVGAPKEIADMQGTVSGLRLVGKRQYVRVVWDDCNEADKDSNGKLVLPQFICALGSTQHINNDLPTTI